MADDHTGYRVSQLDLAAVEWLAMRQALGNAADEVHAAPRNAWGPFNMGFDDPELPNLSGQQFEKALTRICEKLERIEDRRYDGVLP